MFGNLITNRQLQTLRRDGCVLIDPWEPKNLKPTHYTLNAGRVLRRGEDGEWDIETRLTQKKSAVELKANEYVIVEVRQTVKIQVDGIVGRFITASTNIEKGLLVVAGQIDSHYGVGGEALRFGVKNLLAGPNEIRLDTRLAHLEFFDLRGITPEPVQRSPEEEIVWKMRVRDQEWERADSDGVRYDRS